LSLTLFRETGAPHCKELLGRLCGDASALGFGSKENRALILLPPIAHEEDLMPAIDLLARGEAIAIAAAFRRPSQLSSEIVWYAESSQKQLRCVRRKSDAELHAERSGRPGPTAFASCPCG
jgi:hypothetical protein